MNDYPTMIATANHVEPVPRRVRAFMAGEKVLDTTHALYVWEWPNYPQYYIPLADVRQTRTGRSADRRQVSGPPLPNTSSDSSHCPVARGARIEGEQTMLADGIPADEVAVHIQTSTEIEESSRKLGLTPPQRVRRGYVCGSKRLPSTQLVERRASLRS